MEVIDPLIDPLRFPQFAPAFVLGVLGLIAGLLLRLAGTSRVAGGLLTGAVLVALAVLQQVDLNLPAGLLLAAASVAGLQHKLLPRTAGLACAVAAGVVLTTALGFDHLGARLLAVGATVAAIVALPAFERTSSHRGLGPVFVLVVAGGLYACLPDTEEARVLMAAALPLAGLSRAGRASGLGVTGAALVAGLLGWVIATGGGGRLGSLTGAYGAPGLLLIAPAVRGLLGRTRLDDLPPSLGVSVGVVAAQTAFALLISRTAGLQHGLGGGLAIAVPLLLVLVVALLPRRAAGTGR